MKCGFLHQSELSRSPRRPAKGQDLHRRLAVGGAQAAEAEQIINDYGFVPEQNILQPSHWLLYVPPAVAVGYANAYARASVTDNLCGFSYGATDPATDEPSAERLAPEALIAQAGGPVEPGSEPEALDETGTEVPAPKDKEADPAERQACRYLVIDFGTSQSPKSTRPRDSH